MADTLGEAYLQISIKGVNQYIADLKKLEGITEKSVQKQEVQANKIGRNILASKKALGQQLLREEKVLNQQRLKEEQKVEKQILAFKKAMNKQRLQEEQRSGISGIVNASKNILKAAPAFAVATAAIGLTYGALRGLRDEFIAGLSAVEDYQLKVASMSAFLTTFNKELTKTNAAEIYKASNDEANRLVQTMEKLDSRTIATGKDLTTMAEQFIKGGVKIDIVNKDTKDGFVNIANALKLLTQGQNQEIQMRQEIRALTQGQLRDQNILAKTLSGIDPKIKEHIKLWKQQGTLIKNVGDLLAGFGPAAKDLENTWAVIGTTMETIHTRILRGAFKPTYDSLVQTAKEWNRLLMDSEGNLTPFANKLQSVLKTALSISAALVKGVLLTSLALGVGGAAYLAWTSFVGIIALATGGITALTAAFAGLTAMMMRNPYFAIGAVVVGTALSFLLKEYVEDISKVKDEINAVGAAAEERLARILAARKRSEEIMGRVETRPTRDAGINIVPFISPDILSSSTVEELLKPLKKLSESLRKKTATIKEGTLETLNARLASDEFADALSALRDGGAAAREELDSLLKKTRQYAEEIDKQKENKKAIRGFESLVKSLNPVVDKFEAMREVVRNYLNVIKDPKLFTPAKLTEGMKFLKIIDEKEVKAKIKAVDQDLKDFFKDLDEQSKHASTVGTGWIDGMQAGLKEYQKSASDVFTNVGNIIQKAFKGMEDALVTFVMTGKINFSDLVNSMVADLARLMIQKQILGPLSGVLGAALPGIIGGFSGAGASPASTIGYVPPSANGNVFANQGLQAFANGAAFTNTIVDKPTLFPFANGTGLMGEAGPEAIMPLERNSKGQLGVVSAGGSGNDRVIINNMTGSEPEVKEVRNAKGGMDILVTIKKAVAADIQSGNGVISKAIQNTFTASPQLVRR